ncbi:hypothetical protein AGMMS49950_10740 [Endomicrobiia bacterium]|nr:hypothetical protein AGMMS49950_10740 [Endomicrobiia bacterium]
MLAIIVMFACTSICFGEPSLTLGSNATHGRNVAGNSANPNGSVPFSKNPNKCTLIVSEGATVKNASGARIDLDSHFTSMTDNKIIVEGGDFSNGNISGAYSLSEENVNVNGNTVKINAGEGIRNVFGGYTKRGTVSGNEVFIKNEVTIGGYVYGGHVFGNGNANNNKVTISSSTDSASSVSSTSPRVSAPAPSSSSSNDERIKGNVLGGRVHGDGDAKKNIVTINDERIKGHVFGGCVDGKGDAENNEVTITNTTVGLNINGGCVFGNGYAEKNKVAITSTTVGGNVYGGYVHGNGDAENNEVTITSATVDVTVFGGFVNGNGDAKNNKFTINGGRIGKNVFGGFVYGNNKGNATGNTVTISGTPKFRADRILCGGIGANNESDAFTFIPSATAIPCYQNWLLGL